MKVPSPEIFTIPSASQDAGDEAGVIRHVTEVFKPATELAKPEVPVSVVNAAVPPGATLSVFGVATGKAGKPTVTLMNAAACWVVESATTYFTDDAVPLKVGNGSKVTVPFALTRYVPSLATKSSVNVQLAFAVEIVAPLVFV